MRRVGGLVAGLLLVGWILIEIPVAPTDAPAAAPEWKRTVDGWELETAWYPAARIRPAQLHPAVLGTLQLLVSLLALLAFADQPEPARRGTSTRVDQPRRGHRGSRRRASIADSPPLR